MALIRKAIMLAVTSGLAKKAWDSYRQKNPASAGRAKASMQQAKSNLTDAGKKIAGGDRDNKPGSY